MIFKLLVVDDEVTMRKGISNYMNWHPSTVRLWEALLTEWRP